MRIRDIIHRDGARLRLSLAAGDSGDGPLLRLTEPEALFPASVMLDLYGIELLAGFLMSARLSAVGELADESCTGDTPLRMRLCAQGGANWVEIEQSGTRLLLHRKLWDRLYAELQLALAHGRHLRDVAPAIELALREARRLLH
ncbi:hypothetical protein [Sphingomonas glaciei]|uniref:Uncharacterized protein n=1 Tax=Sphingomonas glaciei TaxID=2938948 RepID=A0ABY5MU66_9SPHN|nr:hypothetical protein [Sphingomonas glaciei]UUR07514.1 hypothetical protein M1K48_11280 [Sphingomonas glaciei]